MITWKFRTILFSIFFYFDFTYKSIFILYMTCTGYIPVHNLTFLLGTFRLAYVFWVNIQINVTFSDVFISVSCLYPNELEILTNYLIQKLFSWLLVSFFRRKMMPTKTIVICACLVLSIGVFIIFLILSYYKPYIILVQFSHYNDFENEKSLNCFLINHLYTIIMLRIKFSDYSN